jgi:histidine ammonia-lyase
MTIILDGQNLTVGKLVQIARHGERMELYCHGISPMEY